MIQAMLTLVVMTLLMMVALMFAAEIGWLMVDPTRRENRADPRVAAW
jgi:hypothetical protein